MAEKALSGGEGLQKALARIAKKMQGNVKVGFLENATYPDGTPVAAVAFWNEFGKMVAGKDGGFFQLPRPFFRRMISAEAPTWAPTIAALAKANDYDAAKVFALIGEDVKAALQESINEFTTPALAESTVERKGFAKPLIDTGHMQRSVDYEVEE